MEKTVREYLKEGAGFLPSKSTTELLNTDKFLDMPMSIFMDKAVGCSWVLVSGLYEVNDEDN